MAENTLTYGDRKAIWRTMLKKLQLVTATAETEQTDRVVEKDFLMKLCSNTDAPTNDEEIANNVGDLCWVGTAAGVGDIYMASAVCHNVGSLTTTWTKVVD